MSVKAADLDRVFAKLEMVTRDGKDKLAWFVVDGKRVLFTRRSHGSGDVGGVAHLVRQQLKVNEETFRGLIQCPVSRADYVAILKRKNFV